MYISVRMFISVYILYIMYCGLMGRVFANGPGASVQSHVESYQRLRKWYLMLPCLTPSIIRLGSRVEWSSPMKDKAPRSKS